MNAKDNDDRHDADESTLSPLPGEAGIPSLTERTRAPVSRKGLFAVAFLVLSMVAVTAVSIQHVVARRKPDDAASARAGDRPAAVSVQPKRLDMTAPVASSAMQSPDQLRIPAIKPLDDDATTATAEPIGVRRTGSGAATGDASGNGGHPDGAKVVLPEDAPVILVTRRNGPPTGSPPAPPVPANRGDDVESSASPLAETRRNLEAYERQLQALMESMTRTSGNDGTRTAVPTGSLLRTAPVGVPPSAAPPMVAETTLSGALLGGLLPRSTTPRVKAALLGDRSMILPKGTAFTCALQTKVVSSAAGLIGCQVQRNVFSDDGRVLLIERGSHMDGEYRVASIKPGSVSIPVLWTRIRTPLGVTVDIDSPGTGRLGESGIDGYVDNRWRERIGAALLLSLIDDSVQLAIQHESGAGQGSSVVLPSTTSNASKLADKVLDSTINIPPLIYQNQGGIVGIVVARDVDFSAVYALQPTTP